MHANYNLNAPGVVKEIKDVLVALSKKLSDPMTSSRPQVERIWKHIDLSPDYADAWDGATADEFVLMLGRLLPLRSFFDSGPLTQLAPQTNKKGQEIIVGGPQPTVSGLELLAQANHKILNDSVDMGHYLAWRGGGLDDWFSGPPNVLVIQTTRMGRPWDDHGWTMAWRDGPAAQADPELLSELDMLEDSLKTSWQAAPLLKTEKDRTTRANILEQLRAQREALVKKLNTGAPPPECKDGFFWSKPRAACVPRCQMPGQTWDPVTQSCAVKLPTVTTAGYDDLKSCIEAHLSQGFDQHAAETFCSQEFPTSSLAKIGFLAPAAGAAAFLYWLMARHDKPLPTKWTAPW